ncbi:MAG TPA: glycoside hydrolase family 66 protein [Chloroflexia bacterium]|nr:glycoside hydrolase family 66 protein [Chloroflexia bacterium]
MTILESGQILPTITSPQVTVVDFRPDKAFYRPGQLVNLLVQLQANQPLEVGLHLKVRYLATTINTLYQPFTLEGAGTVYETSFRLNLPAETPRGYGFELAVESESNGETLAKASTAADVLDGWPQMPRYGFFANFKSEESAAESVARAWVLSAYHVNVVQFYDWMYRHEDYIPPADDFIDPMGRAVSFATVRHKIEAAHNLNMAALAYGAVYGATPAFWETHQDWGIYQADGQPYSLEKLFYLMDISLDSPWAENILTQYEKAVRQAGFDGIHVDQYGYPKIAYTLPSSAGESSKTLELAQLFPPIINEAARRVSSLKQEGGVIFNAVNNWPIETVAATDQSAVYIEVWSPYVEYKDLHDLIVNARQLARSSETNKQVILAAYLTPFLPEGLKVSDNAATEEAPHAESGALPTGPATGIEGAQNAARLATAAIYASGGFHLLLGENNAVLADPYYPHYGHFQPDFVVQMRRYYDFLVRYENILSNPQSNPVPAAEVEQQISIHTGERSIEVSGEGKAGSVWAVMHETATYTSLNLINLQGLSNSLWNAFKETPAMLSDLQISVKLPDSQASAITKVWTASPDNSEVAWELEVERVKIAGDTSTWLTFKLPNLAYWSLVVFEKEPGNG